MTDTLSRCPFCNKHLEYRASLFNSHGAYFLHPPVDEHEDKCIIHNVWIEADDKDCVAKWNRRAPPPETNTTVTPLVWKDHREDIYSSSNAESVFGVYTVFSFNVTETKTEGVISRWSGLFGNGSDVGSFEEAKAAAEEHYRQRILSALSPATMPLVAGPEQEAGAFVRLAEAGKKYREAVATYNALYKENLYATSESEEALDAVQYELIRIALEIADRRAKTEGLSGALDCFLEDSQ